MITWIYVLEETTLPEGHMAPVYPLGINIVLAHVGGMIHGIAGMCMHMACPLFMGKLEGNTITCPCHDWRFDVRTGKFNDAPELSLKVYPTKSEAGKVYIGFI